MDRIQFAAKTKEVNGEIVVVVPQHVLERLGIKEGDEFVFEMRKYGTAVLPKKHI